MRKSIIQAIAKQKRSLEKWLNLIKKIFFLDLKDVKTKITSFLMIRIAEKNI
jgi:hypothetical protein